MKKKVSLSQNFYLRCVYILSCEAHKHCRAEIAQYRLEIIFNTVFTLATGVIFYENTMYIYIKTNITKHSNVQTRITAQRNFLGDIFFPSKLWTC